MGPTEMILSPTMLPMFQRLLSTSITSYSQSRRSSLLGIRIMRLWVKTRVAPKFDPSQLKWTQFVSGSIEVLSHSQTCLGCAPNPPCQSRGSWNFTGRTPPKAKQNIIGPKILFESLAKILEHEKKKSKLHWKCQLIIMIPWSKLAAKKDHLKSCLGG